MIMKKKLSADCTLGLWDIRESYDELFRRLRLTREEKERLAQFRNPDRKVEWLSVRALINEMTGANMRIIYNMARKPFLRDNSHNISISHSKNLTSILLSKSHRVGLDLEHMSHRISAIAHRFINDKEYIASDESLSKYHLYIHWCAKEALYKICDKKGINFKKNLTIKPFHPNMEGTLEAVVVRFNQEEHYRLHYFRLENYAIVWCCK